jgi:hypothetical protein|tara:strand:+ start:168 stop:491 length:324 start_codon:yes stop_codon:yes gene_type:complete
MPFQKGKKKTGGRVKNQPNKTSKEIRDASMLILSGQIETLENLLPTLKPNDYLKAIQMLYKVCLPQQRQIETETINHPTNFEIQIIDRLSQVSDSDVEDAIQKSISK